MKEIKNYSSYKISENGDVFSFKRKSGVRKLKWQKATQSKKGYFQVRLWNEFGDKLYYVHRLVWETFEGDIPKNKQIDHIDGDTSNNHISNLQLVTIRQNTKKYHNAVDKYRNHRDEFVKDYENFGTYRAVADKWECSCSTAWYIVNNLVLKSTKDGYIYVPYRRN